MKTLLLERFGSWISAPFMILATVKKTDLIATLALIGPRSNINPLQSSLEDLVYCGVASLEVSHNVAAKVFMWLVRKLCS
jgi:hypothetical protein